MRTLEQLDAAVTTLESRVNVVDGTGLPPAEKGEIPKLRADIAGLRTTIEQVALLLEAELNSAKTELANLKALLNAHVGA